MALSAPAYRKYHGHQDEISVPLAESDTYYLGAVLVFDGDGYGAVPSDTANLAAAGVVTGMFEGGDTTDEKEVGSGDHPRAVLRRGKVWLPLSSVATSDRGELAYLSDDDTLTQTAGSKTVSYWILDVDTDAELALVDLRVPDRTATS